MSHGAIIGYKIIFLYNAVVYCQLEVVFKLSQLNPLLKIVFNASLINGLQLFLSKLSRVVFVYNLQPIGQEFKCVDKFSVCFLETSNCKLVISISGKCGSNINS